MTLQAGAPGAAGFSAPAETIDPADTAELRELRWGPVPPHVTFPLRQQLLRPHETVAEMALPGDDAVESAFFAVWPSGHPGSPVGVVTVRREARPEHPEDQWRLRGLAVLPARRGAGVGSLLVRCIVDHVRRHHGASVWCAVRTTAEDFYRRRGFEVRGERYELPAIGTHVPMVRVLSP